MDAFIKIPDTVLLDKRLHHTHMILYWVILSRANNDDNCCFATNQTLWNRIGRNKYTISKLLKELEGYGYIEVIDWSLRKITPIVTNTKGVVMDNKGGCHEWQGGLSWTPTIQDNIQDNIQEEKLKKDNSSKTQSSAKKKKRTKEQKEKFETFWKIYPHKDGRSIKKDAKTHFFEKDYNEMMFSAKMLKRKTIMHPDKAEYVKWCHRWINNFEAPPEYIKKQALRELYRRHMTAWWDMKARMEEIVRDFPDVDFSEFREELSKEKTEYAIWAFIHGR